MSLNQKQGEKLVGQHLRGTIGLGDDKGGKAPPPPPPSRLSPPSNQPQARASRSFQKTAQQLPHTGPAITATPVAIKNVHGQPPSCGDASMKPPPVQSGTVSSEVANGMQFPSRTISAPPNMDEQKKTQVCQHSFRAVPALPMPSAQEQCQHPQQQLPCQHHHQQLTYQLQKQLSKQDMPALIIPDTHHNIGKWDMISQAQTAPITSLPRPSSIPVAGMYMPMPCQSQQVPIQFGGHEPHSQSGVASGSLEKAMGLSMGSFLEGSQQIYNLRFQSHTLQPLTIMPKGQGVGYIHPTAPYMTPQFGNVGIRVFAPESFQQQWQQKQAKFSGQRKASSVKITHPETHEELKFDNWINPQVDHVFSTQIPLSYSTQDQTLPSFSPPNHVQPGSFIPPASGSFIPHGGIYNIPSHTFSSTAMATYSQVPRFSYLAGCQSMTSMNQSHLSSMSSGVVETLHRAPESINSLRVSSSSAPVQVTVKQSSLANRPCSSSVRISFPAIEAEAPKSAVFTGITSLLSQKVDNEVSRECLGQQSKSVEPSVISTLPAADPHLTASASIQGVSLGNMSKPVVYIGNSEAFRQAADDKIREYSKIQVGKQNEKNDKNLGELKLKDDCTSAVDANVFVPKTSNGNERILEDITTAHSEDISAIFDDVSATSLSSLSTEHVMSSEGIKTEISYSESACSSSSQALYIHEDNHGGPPFGDNLKTFIEGETLRVTQSNVHCIRGSLSAGPQSSFEDGHILSEVLVKQETVGKDRYGKTRSSDHFLQHITSVEKPISAAPSPSDNVIQDLNAKLQGSGLVMDKLVSSYERGGECEQSHLCKEIEDGRFKTTNMVESNSVEAGSPAISGRKKASSAMPKGETICGDGINLSGPIALSKRADIVSAQSISVMPPVSNEKSLTKPSKAKNIYGKKKKKRESFNKDVVEGASDLSNAYKITEENNKIESVIGSYDNSLIADSNFMIQDDIEKDVAKAREDMQCTTQVDDQEAAADFSVPKLINDGKKASISNNSSVNDGYEMTNKKKYSRDLLLSFQEQCTSLPVSFEVGHDVNIFMNLSVAASNFIDRKPCPGRMTLDHSLISRGGRRLDVLEDDKWIKAADSLASGHDFHMDASHGTSALSLRPVHVVNNCVLRDPCGQSSRQSAGGILSLVPQSCTTHNDADRWQRATDLQRGLMSSLHCHTHLQVMHKAGKKYEVGKVSDIEEAKQRQLKGILNKLTPQNFEKLFQQVKDVNIDNAVTLNGVISQIFDKALMEPTFCEMYADFCLHLSNALPDFIEENEKINFKRLLLTKCQEEFERGVREQEEADKTDEEGESKKSVEKRGEKRSKARRRMLGNIRLIGELYKKKMLTERIMHECIKKLFGQNQNPDEEDIEALCKLMSTIGGILDHSEAKKHMDAYFDVMHKLSINKKISSRLRFMLRDVIDLRRNKWQARRKVEGPKKIEEVHRDAAQERQAQMNRLSRDSGASVTSRKALSTDYGLRGSSVFLSPSSHQSSGLHGVPPQPRDFSSQEVRMEDRLAFKSKTFSVPIPQRASTDDIVTFGSPSGLGRGIPIRGSPLISCITSDQISASTRHSRTTVFALDGYAEIPATNNTVESFGSKSASPETRLYSVETLREKSILAIREYYSAKDKDEVVLCVKELSSPNFYPDIISHWITDSFEMEDKERDLLATLLASLCKSEDNLFNEVQFFQGIESVLSNLEDAVNDAPRAAEFLGSIFAKLILEGVVLLRDIGRLIHRGGEEPGRLLEIGLASKVFGTTLEIMRTKNGDSILDEIRMGSDLKLEDFRLPYLL